jgi:hypothetical protein
MGLEASCKVTFGARASDGVAHLEPEALSFKGDFALKIPIASIAAFDAKAGKLTVTFGGETATFHLGPQAEKWMLKIRYPRGRIEKLGVKDTFVVSVLDVDDDSFLRELDGRAAVVATGRRPRAASDLIVYGVTARTALDRLTALRGSIVPAGAIWVVWPKGRKELREDDVRAAARAQGLVDVKVMSFSDTLSALKLVIPVAQRAQVADKRIAKKQVAKKR